MAAVARTTYYFRVLAAVVVAALAASVLLALVGSKPAKAAFPGKNGKIAYSAYDGSHNQIYTIPSGGGKPTKVTKDATDHDAPAFSLDGKTIVYETVAPDASTTSYNPEIYTVPSGGGKLTQVTTDDTDHEAPTFSPNGKTIAYDAWEGSHFQIYTIPFPSSGATPTPVTSGPANHTDPAFSPDGTKITYSGYDGSHYQIYTIPFPSSGVPTPTPLTNEDTQHSFPDFSPDGNTIVYDAFDNSNNRQLYTIPSNPPSGGGTETPKQLTNDDTVHRDPAFSPDGSKIVYDSHFNSGLYTIPFPYSGETPTPVNTNKHGGTKPNWGVSTGHHHR
jgi:Tol biopolymer transport system component